MSATIMIRQAKARKIPLRPPGGPNRERNRAALAQATTAPIILRPTLTNGEARERLRRFAAAASYPTLTAAANALRLQLSPLSTQIRRLEHDLGGLLLERTQRSHPMRLTSLGTKVIAAIATWSPQEKPPS
jgi:hypothetical protein